jgi:hypothetical protein
MEKSQVVERAPTKLAPLPGTSIQEIQTTAKTIKTSISDLLSAIPDQSIQLALKTFLANILASASKIEALSESFLTTNPVGQFIFFPKLPIELRLKIWELTFPGPRIIEIYKQELCRSEYQIEIQANNPPLTLFHVNREAREVASKKYIPLTESCLSLIRGDTEVYCCHAKFDPVQDTIYIPWSVDLDDNTQFFLMNGEYWSVDACAKVQYLAIDSQMWQSGSDLFELMFIDFTALKEFTIVVHERDESLYSCDEQCVERWRMHRTGLTFEEPRWRNPTNAGPQWQHSTIADQEHKRFIEKWYNMVLDKMEETRKYAEDNDIEWNIPNIEVKILTRKGQRCCWNQDW